MEDDAERAFYVEHLHEEQLQLVHEHAGPQPVSASIEQEDDVDPWTALMRWNTYGHMIGIHICMRSYRRIGMNPCSIQRHIRIFRLEHSSEVRMTE